MSSDEPAREAAPPDGGASEALQGLSIDKKDAAPSKDVQRYPGPDGKIRDSRRIDFFRGYLEALHRAIEAGADVRGYHAWTLMDNFEWSEGFEQRFGLTWVDFETGERTVKESGHWYASVVRDNGFET